MGTDGNVGNPNDISYKFGYGQCLNLAWNFMALGISIEWKDVSCECNVEMSKLQKITVQKQTFITCLAKIGDDFQLL